MYYSGQIEVKHCSMIIPDQYTQTTDLNSIIEVLIEAIQMFKREVRRSNVILALKVR